MTDSTTQAPGPELKRLNALVGSWDSKGQTRATSDSPSIQIQGTDVYEWLPGGFFLMHRVDVHMGDDKVDTLEMIGPYDAATQSYPMRAFDNAGHFAVMHARVSKDGVWTFADDSTRATLTIAADGQSMSAFWEQKSDGSDWQPWMDMTFTKAK